MTAAGERPGEMALIERFFAPLATDPGAAGLTDDAAVLSLGPGEELVATTDALAAGVHFFPDDPPGAIAAKALRVNLSDLAAKGARPRGYLLTLALPADWTVDWLAAFAAGLAADQADYGCPLLGGDTIRSPAGLMVSVAAFGIAPAGRTVRRGTAAPGDRLVVTGTIGDAALGLVARNEPARAAAWRLADADAAFLDDRFLLPRPRVAAAAAVAAHARAAMDVSDGLAGDLGRMCKASGVAAVVEAARVPLSPAAAGAIAAEPGLLARALTGGDDYEILAAVPPGAVAPYLAACAAAGVAAAEIGTVEAGAGARFVDGRGAALALGAGAYAHF